MVSPEVFAVDRESGSLGGSQQGIEEGRGERWSSRSRPDWEAGWPLWGHGAAISYDLIGYAEMTIHIEVHPQRVSMQAAEDGAG